MDRDGPERQTLSGPLIIGQAQQQSCGHPHSVLFLAACSLCHLHTPMCASCSAACFWPESQFRVRFFLVMNGSFVLGVGPRTSDLGKKMLFGTLASLHFVSCFMLQT